MPTVTLQAIKEEMRRGSTLQSNWSRVYLILSAYTSLSFAERQQCVASLLAEQPVDVARDDRAMATFDNWAERFIKHLDMVGVTAVVKDSAERK